MKSSDPIPAQVNIEYQLPGGDCVYFGDIKYYTIYDDENDEIMINACYLSNNYVMLPYHCLQVEDLTELKYGDTLSDFAIMEVQIQTESLAPSQPKRSDIFRLDMDHNTTVALFRRISKFYVEFQFAKDLESGDSGSIIFGYGQFTNGITQNCSEGCSPLFMIIARDRNSHKFGLAISLPELLTRIRLNPTDPTNYPLPVIPTEWWDSWEPISSFGEVKVQVNKDATERFQGTKRTERIKELTSSPSRAAEIEILKTLFADKSQADLQNAFLVSVPVGTNQSDKCWVVKYEKENLAASTGYFKAVGNYMKAKEMVNINGTEVYSTTSQPITLDQQSFNYFNSKLKNYHTACHHPFLCELNDACKGDKRKKSTKKNSFGHHLESRYLSHCCIRPSHLVNLNKDFNSHCTVLQGIYGNEQSTMTTSWTRK